MRVRERQSHRSGEAKAAKLLEPTALGSTQVVLTACQRALILPLWTFAHTCPLADKSGKQRLSPQVSGKNHVPQQEAHGANWGSHPRMLLESDVKEPACWGGAGSKGSHRL